MFNIESIFANKTVLSCFFLFFFDDGLYFLIPSINAEIFKTTEELTKIPKTPTNEANA